MLDVLGDHSMLEVSVQSLRRCSYLPKLQTSTRRRSLYVRCLRRSLYVRLSQCNHEEDAPTYPSYKHQQGGDRSMLDVLGDHSMLEVSVQS